ncbi:MAG: Orotate phosphoribosyltransferase [Pseudomonadota bacterium]|jgi:orotate phosphoribosyltransferase
MKPSDSINIPTNIPINFLQFALDTNVLKFGQFTTKAGRQSPYFFNAGLFNDGMSLWQLSNFYAETLNLAQSNGLNYDMLFGPAYKGITLVAGVACVLAAQGKNIPYTYNRKEAKLHGEGGTTVGAPLKGRVVIIDDVISAGTSVTESVALIKAAGATPVAVLIALDRMERSGNAIDIGSHSAVQAVQDRYGIPVYAIANLDNLMDLLINTDNIDLIQYCAAMSAYRQQYGI